MRTNVTSPISVAVVTLTRNRPHALRRNLASVKRQNHQNVTQYVIGDRCEFLSSDLNLRALQEEFPDAVFSRNTARVDDYLPTHLARLRFNASRQATADVVAVLDDDNEYEFDHLSRLLHSMDEAGSDAAHSWRSLWAADGRPWLIQDEDPWVPDQRLSKISFRALSALGVLKTGSNIVRDSLSYAGKPGRVDSNEWLLSRALFEEYAAPHQASRAERRLQFTEDVLLSRRLISDAVCVATSPHATVRYYMGGYSNQNDNEVLLEGAQPEGE
ncbi:hypothetical protein ABMA10_18610 [Plantibacter sp. RU18]